MVYVEDWDEFEAKAKALFNTRPHQVDFLAASVCPCAWRDLCAWR